MCCYENWDSGKTILKCVEHKHGKFCALYQAKVFMLHILKQKLSNDMLAIECLYFSMGQ